jgi:hypothetical protein
MNIEVKVDEVTLATVVEDIVGYDNESGPYLDGHITVGDLVARHLVDAVKRDSDRYRALVTKVGEIRAEMIREAIAPQIEKALTAPLRKTNQYGEATGQETTLRELIVAEAQKALTEPAGGNSYDRDRKTLIQKTVADEVQKALAGEIADAVKAARQQVATEIGKHVAAAVQGAMRTR